MNSYIFLVLILLSQALAFGASVTTSKYESEEVLLLSLDRRSGLTNEWITTVGKLAAAPKWKPGELPPLDLNDALKLASTWAAQNGFDQKLDIHKIEIQRLHGGADLPFVYYYVVQFVPRIFDRMAVVILMDGTIVEPSVPARKVSPAPAK